MMVPRGTFLTINEMCDVLVLLKSDGPKRCSTINGMFKLNSLALTLNYFILISFNSM